MDTGGSSARQRADSLNYRECCVRSTDSEVFIRLIRIFIQRVEPDGALVTQVRPDRALALGRAEADFYFTPRTRDMILARIESDTQGRGLLIGLSRRNIERLIAGEPIYKDDLPGQAGLGHLIIMFGETEAGILEDIRTKLSPDVAIDGLPG